MQVLLAVLYNTSSNGVMQRRNIFVTCFLIRIKQPDFTSAQEGTRHLHESSRCSNSSLVGKDKALCFTTNVFSTKFSTQRLPHVNPLPCFDSCC